MKIRPATEADCPAIAAIWNPTIRDTLITFTDVEQTPAHLAAMLAAKKAAGVPFLVAEDADGAILGFATYGAFRKGPGYAATMEHSIMLASAAQGRGTGRALMQALEQAAQAAGVHSLIAGISGVNTGAIAFHRALGFAMVGHLPEVGFKAGQWLDLVLMQKIL